MVDDLTGQAVGVITGIVVFAFLWFLFNYFPAIKRAGIFDRPRVKYRVLAQSFKMALLFGVFFVLVNFLIEVFKDVF